MVALWSSLLRAPKFPRVHPKLGPEGRLIENTFSQHYQLQNALVGLEVGTTLTRELWLDSGIVFQGGSGHSFL